MLLWLAQKAFFPTDPSLLHVDTTYKFREMTSSAIGGV